MAEKSYSVAEARQSLARLIRSAGQGRAVRITRRGQPVAVLLSAVEYLALSGESRSFAEAFGAIRERLDVDQLGIGAGEFTGLRDDSPGRVAKL